jgi:hypothetical protein
MHTTSYLHRFFILCLTLCALPFIQAQEEQGFLNIANLVPGDKPCNINIAGKELVPSGLKSIESTGWFIVPAGEHQMSLAVEGYKTAAGSITITPGVSTLYVVFLQQIGDKVDKNGNPNPPQIRIKKCEPFAETKGHYLKAMSFCPDEERFDLGPNILRLKMFGNQEITNWNGGAFALKHGNEIIGTCSGSQEKGSYYLLIGTDHRKAFASLLVRNEKQELPPWMKKPQKP